MYFSQQQLRCYHVGVCLHSQVPLLEREEFSFPLVFGVVREVFL